MNCIIIDDEATARAIIEQLCNQLPILNVLEVFPNAMQAIKFLNNNSHVDLIFLDIHMPDFTGFDFIETIKDAPKIILTTSDSQCAIQAFEYHCIIDYLVKPIALPRFKKAVAKAQAEIKKDNLVTNNVKTQPSNTDNDLYINIDRRLIKLNMQSIYLIEAKGDYVLVKTDTKNYTVHTTLKKVEDKLPKNIFLKIHRSYIINTTKIIDIEDNSVLIKKDVVPVSRSNRAELMNRLNLL